MEAQERARAEIRDSRRRGRRAGGDTGTESPLVGKPAPDFTLDLVGGKSFHLAESKGKEVVVLDFWATWCGPCLQAMPQVERAAAQFKDQNVRLVAVNLQETAEQVTALLERQKLHVTVALDRDGAVAEKYKAVAIPQTVIIGRDGNVARLFVGGGPHLEDQLKEAITAALDGREAEGTERSADLDRDRVAPQRPHRERREQPGGGDDDEHDQGHAAIVAFHARVQQAPDQHRHRLCAGRSKPGWSPAARPARSQTRPPRRPERPSRRAGARRGRTGPDGPMPSSAAASR